MEPAGHLRRRTNISPFAKERLQALCLAPQKPDRRISGEIVTSARGAGSLALDSPQWRLLVAGYPTLRAGFRVWRHG